MTAEYQTKKDPRHAVRRGCEEPSWVIGADGCLAQQVSPSLAPALGPIGGCGPGWSPPYTARMEQLSATARDQRAVPSTAAAASSRADSWLAGADEERFRIVYVEDNPANLALMEELVASLGEVSLRSAPTAEIGLELVRAYKPHVVILDINLPGMNGFEALQLLRQSPDTRQIPVIALSAAAMDRDKQRAAKAGFYRP
jgi:CheY-like chemotaxis protein